MTARSRAEEFLAEPVTVLYNECHVINGELIAVDDQGILVRSALKNLIPIDHELIMHIGRWNKK